MLDSYLEIARVVLKSARRPLGAATILDMAYEAGVVPSHLYGQTQQKTLQARLSEDILNNRETSAFFRTEPGRFFLVEFLDDPKIPDEWRIMFPARRRTRDLRRDNSLGVKIEFLEDQRKGKHNFQSFLKMAETVGAISYMNPEEMENRGYRSAWTFSVVFKKENILAYRIGKYRDDGLSFTNKRSIGFPGALAFEDTSLFSVENYGAEECSKSVLAYDLDLSFSVFEKSNVAAPKIDSIIIIDKGSNTDLVILLQWNCPDWFEPTTKRLSINDPHWLAVSTRHNDLDDFEPWSSEILSFLSDASMKV